LDSGESGSIGPEASRGRLEVELQKDRFIYRPGYAKGKTENRFEM